MLSNISENWLKFWAIALSWVMVVIGTALAVEGPIDYRRMVGEVILAVVGSFIMYAFGMYQGFETWQMMFVGSLAGLGGVRGIEWLVKISKQISKLKL